MSGQSQPLASVETPYVSIGHLPTPETIQALVAEAHAPFQSNMDGQNSQVYPALARMPSQLFGICIVDTSGNVYAVGDSDYEFTMMSVSQPFVFALVIQLLGTDTVRAKFEVNATGRAFNSVEGIEREMMGGRTRWSIRVQSPQRA